LDLVQLAIEKTFRGNVSNYTRSLAIGQLFIRKSHYETFSESIPNMHWIVHERWHRGIGALLLIWSIHGLARMRYNMAAHKRNFSYRILIILQQNLTKIDI
jgi:hypothetical protein